MSRIGNKPIPINKIKISIDGQKVKATGNKGVLERTFPDVIKIEDKENQLYIKRVNDHRTTKSLHGLARSLIANMVEGVDNGFKKDLEIHGVGYRAQIKGKKLVLNLGFSHPIEFDIPEYVSIKVTDNTKLTIEGIDKQQVGQIAAIIRDFKRPEPYKGKGVRYTGEIIVMKEGKTV